MAVEETTIQEIDVLEIIDPKRRIILRGTPFEPQEGESGEAFESRWRAIIAVDPPKRRVIYTGHEGLAMPSKAENVTANGEAAGPDYDPKLEAKVDGLDKYLDDMKKRLEELAGKGVSGETASSQEGFDYKGLQDRAERLDQRLAALGGTTSPAAPAFDYQKFANILGGSLGSALKDALGGLAEALAKAGPRAPAPSYAPPPQYAPAPQSAPAPTPSSGGAPDYGAMDYKGVRRAVFDNLGNDEAARMLLDKALLNCGNPRGEETLGKLVSRHPQQAEALHAFFRKHRERIGIEKPKPAR